MDNKIKNITKPTTVNSITSSDIHLPISELTLHDISINLRLISKIEIGDKLYPTDKYINIDNSWMPSVTRWLYGVNRNKNLEFITSIINRAFILNNSISNDKSPEAPQMLLRLTSDLSNSIHGLLNLKQTYISDKLIQSELDVMIENIRNKVDSNNKKINFS